MIRLLKKYEFKGTAISDCFQMKMVLKCSRALRNSWDILITTESIRNIWKNAEFAQNSDMEGFIFHQIWRLKASKSTDLKNFLRYFLWPFLNQISEITSCHLFSSQLLVLSLAFYLKEYLFLPTYLFYFISSKINRFKSQSIHTAIDWFMYNKK